MATLFAPRFYAQPQPNLRGLFRLLDEFDQYSGQSQQQQCQRPQRRVQVFTPRFDVTETESTYELHGELPGVDKDNINIEFTDPQTVVIRGKVERSQSAGTPPAAVAAPEATPDEEMSGALPNATEEDEAVLVEHDHASETSSVRSLQATVEDDPEEPAGQATPATTVAETAKPAAAAPAQAAAPAPQDTTPKARYWVSERSVGHFTRSFHFPSRVEHEFVTASMANGILTVSVPKAKKHQSHRITIN